MAKPNIVGQDLEDLLNRCMPVAQRAKLGSVLYDLVNKHNALLAKLDADVGVSGTDYVATLKIKLPEDR